MISPLTSTVHACIVTEEHRGTGSIYTYNAHAPVRRSINPLGSSSSRGEIMMLVARSLSLSWRIGWSYLSGGLKSRTPTIKIFSSRIPNITCAGLTHQYSLASRNIDCQISHNSPFLLQKCLPLRPLPLSPFMVYSQQCRSIVRVSKNKGKLKTVKAVAKRFHRTGSGKLKYWPAGKVHNMLAKSNKRRRQLRKPKYATKTQLKTLNKMISGW